MATQELFKEKEVYKFFINNSEVYAPKKGIENDYDGLKKGLADKADCFEIKMNAENAKKMLMQKTYILHKHIECVEVPKNAELSMEQVNLIIKKQNTAEEVTQILIENTKKIKK